MDAMAHRFLILLLLVAPAVAQGTYTAASCSRTDVNAVINGPTHTAVNGDVIQIPAGSCTWTSNVTVATGIGITIVGAGTPNSGSSTTGASASCSQTAITDDSTSGTQYLFVIQPTASASLSRISCMKLLGDSATVAPPIEIGGSGCTSLTCGQVRIDNITFDASLQNETTGSGSMIVADNVFGVIDHTTTSGSCPTGSCIGMEFISYNHSSWQGTGNYGDNSWASADSFGTAQELYLENNYWGPSVVISETEAQPPAGLTGQGGGRLAVRFNNCNGCISGASNHGTDSLGRPRGGRSIEFYANTFICGNSGGCQGATPIRSGVNLVWGNSLQQYPGDVPYHTWFNQYVAFSIFRIDTINSPPWNQCPGPYDQASPLICLDQPNRSGGTYLSGAPNPTPTGWPGQPIDPTYEWDDAGYNPVFGNVNTSYTAELHANRDWYTDSSSGTPHVQTSATSPFNGASGVGFGTLANRPTTCTVAVGYWATDQGSWNTSGQTYTGGYTQGELFVCTSTNTWTLYYTPYTYPHPLDANSNSPTSPAPFGTFFAGNYILDGNGGVENWWMP